MKQKKTLRMKLVIVGKYPFKILRKKFAGAI